MGTTEPNFPQQVFAFMGGGGFLKSTIMNKFGLLLQEQGFKWGGAPFLEHLETSNGFSRIAFSFDFYERYRCGELWFFALRL